VGKSTLAAPGWPASQIEPRGLDDGTSPVYPEVQALSSRTQAGGATGSTARVRQSTTSGLTGSLSRPVSTWRRARGILDDATRAVVSGGVLDWLATEDGAAGGISRRRPGTSLC